MSVLDASAQRVINEGHLGGSSHKLVLEQLRNIQDISNVDVQAEMVWSNENAPSLLLMLNSLKEIDLHDLDMKTGRKNTGFLFSQIVGALFQSNINNSVFAHKLLDKTLKVCVVEDNFFLRSWMAEMMDYGLDKDLPEYDRDLMFRVADISPETQAAFSTLFLERILSDDDYTLRKTADLMNVFRDEPRIYEDVKRTIMNSFTDESFYRKNELSEQISIAAYSGHDWAKPYAQSFWEVEEQQSPEQTDLKVMIAMLNTGNAKKAEESAELIRSKGHDFINKNITDAEDLYILVDRGIIDNESIQFDENTSKGFKRGRLDIDLGV